MKSLFNRAHRFTVKNRHLAAAAGQISGAVALLSTAPLAMASTVTASDPFYDFMTTVEGWAGGALGVGLATTMLLVGAGIGVAKNSPMPMLGGVAGAAFLHWGPAVITNVLGAVV